MTQLTPPLVTFKLGRLLEDYKVPESWEKTAHAQTVVTRPFSFPPLEKRVRRAWVRGY